MDSSLDSEKVTRHVREQALIVHEVLRVYGAYTLPVTEAVFLSEVQPLFDGWVQRGYAYRSSHAAPVPLL